MFGSVLFCFDFIILLIVMLCAACGNGPGTRTLEYACPSARHANGTLHSIYDGKIISCWTFLSFATGDLWPIVL